MIHSLHECSPLLARCVDDSVWIMVLIEKIVELMSFARITIGQDAQAGKFAIALQTFASHNQRLTIVSLTLGISANARRKRAAGICAISDSSALPRTVAITAVPVSIEMSPTKSRGPGVPRICS